MEIKGRWMITFLLTVFFLVFFNAWSNESQEKQESVIDYSKVIEIEGRRFVVRGEDVQDPIRKILAYPPIEEGRLTRAQIEKLAREFGLLDETETNPHLRFLDGDIAYWYEQELSIDRLKLEFAARKAVLDAADREGVIIDDQGQLSWAAQQIRADMLRLSREIKASRPPIQDRIN